MNNADRPTKPVLQFQTVNYDGRSILVDDLIDVPEVPDDAPLLMEAGSLRMYAAAPIDKYPIDIAFPVYIESDDMAALVPVESALRRANWTVPADSVLNDEQFLNKIKGSKANVGPETQRSRSNRS